MELGPALDLARLPPATASKRPSSDQAIKRSMQCNLDIRDLVVDKFAAQYEATGEPLPLRALIDGPPLSIDGEVGACDDMTASRCPSATALQQAGLQSGMAADIISA